MEVAWPDYSVYVGEILGRLSVFQALDLLAGDSPESKAAAIYRLIENVLG